MVALRRPALSAFVVSLVVGTAACIGEPGSGCLAEACNGAGVGVKVWTKSRNTLSAVAYDVTAPQDRDTFDSERAAGSPITLPVFSTQGTISCTDSAGVTMTELVFPDDAVGRDVAIVAVLQDYSGCGLLSLCTPKLTGSGQAFVKLQSRCQPAMVPITPAP